VECANEKLRPGSKVFVDTLEHFPGCFVCECQTEQTGRAYARIDQVDYSGHYGTCFAGSWGRCDQTWAIEMMYNLELLFVQVHLLRLSSSGLSELFVVRLAELQQFGQLFHFSQFFKCLADFFLGPQNFSVLLHFSSPRITSQPNSLRRFHFFE